MPFGSEARPSAPAAADVEHMHAAAEVELATNQVELRLLCFSQCPCVLPVAAAVNHALVEHRAKQFVSKVVMSLRNLESFASAADTTQFDLKTIESNSGIPERFPVHAGIDKASRHLVDPVAGPPAV